MKKEVSKEINDALVELGFTKDGKYYRKDNQSIKVYPHTELSEIFRQLIAFGVTKKVWEFKSVMQIIDGY